MKTMTALSLGDVLLRNDVKAPAEAQPFLRTLGEESRATSGRR